jgi:hydroxyacylglutathione hydrolase
MIKKFVCGPLENNTYILVCDDTKDSAIIDPSLGSHKPIISFLNKNNINTPPKILLTHSHWDHIADVSVLKNTLHSLVYVKKEDSDNLKKPGADGLPLFVNIEGALPDVLVKDHDTIKVGKISVEVIATPGHSPGSVCYYIKDEKILFSGDTVFKGAMGNISFPTSDANKMQLSLKKLSLLPQDTKIMPGHGDNTTILSEKKWMDDFAEYF